VSALTCRVGGRGGSDEGGRVEHAGDLVEVCDEACFLGLADARAADDFDEASAFVASLGREGAVDGEVDDKGEIEIEPAVGSTVVDEAEECRGEAFVDFEVRSLCAE
jgi:hypothetical protein